ncbi:MAG TPA: ATP-binding protein [Thermoanaerobaculia bacterium]|nr:ATP-binding protein [Thermoanaerobaculia bacterium]
MGQDSKAPGNAGAAFLLGGGEMGARMRERDWSATPLGPAEQWPQSLKTAVRIVLTSRQPMFVWWGKDLINLYNDAYKAIVGGKHPEALGQPAAVVWREIWDQVGPRAASVILENEGTYDEALLLIMERNGYPEETYYTFSYCPIPADEGGTGGIFCANTDDTQRIIGERQLALLRELASSTADARTFDDACSLSVLCLDSNPYDLPFAMIYLIDPERRRLFLAGTCGIERGHEAVPDAVDLDAGDGLWPFAQVIESHAPCLVSDLGKSFNNLPAGAWRRPPHQAVAVPIAPSGQTGKAGVLIAGLNPFRLFDDPYRGFIGLVAAQIAASIANAQAYEEERRRAESLAELDRAKTTFFSNVSHEFRTPLTLMLGPLDDILSKPVDQVLPENRDLLTIVSRNGQRLLKLVNTLLDFSRIEAGRVQAAYEPTDLAAYTAELASVFRAAVEKAGMTLVVDCPPLPGLVFVDRDMWEKIVLNLVSNAFKYTLAGEIVVSLRARESSAVLSVRDTGTGIPGSELPNLFNRFHRVEGAQGRTQEGTGIGLALVQELVRLHSGTVGVESVYGEGSTFIITLPFGDAHLPADRIGGPRTLASTALSASSFVDEALSWLPDAGGSEPLFSPASATARDAAPEDRPRATVVLADDNADMRRYVERLLAAEYRVIAVADGEEALRAAALHQPDLVITDVMMPKLDGFGLLAALREDPATAAIPIVMLSARAGEEARVEGLQAGADDYLTKPFSARELLARVSGTLALARVRREAMRREEELNAGLKLAMDKLQEADRRKDEFLATLAHELRNPLAPIRNGLQILQLGRGNPERVERARSMMERQVQQMVRLIDELLDLSRISRGKIALRRERVDLATVVASAVETSRPLIDQAGHELTVGLPAEPVFVDADVTRLAQVFANLLNNAAKYTERGGHIGFTVEPTGAEVTVTVKDDGIGIPADMLPRVFEMFAQVDRSLERAQGGLGIGLSIVKRLTEMHGGTVEAKSAGRGRGSELVVRLPALAPLGEEPRSASGEEGVHAPVRRRILVADDNEDSAASLAMMLELMGSEVSIVHDGFEAVEAAARIKPEIVILDIGMPRLNGYEACRRIREQPWSHGSVIVALTGWGQAEDKLRSRDAGFDHHLVKPVEPAVLERLLAERSREAPARP